MAHLDRRMFLGGLAAAGTVAAGSRIALSQPAAAGRIAVHHHFAPPNWLKASTTGTRIWQTWTPQKSLDSMNEGGCQKAYLSITQPGVTFGDNALAIRLARDANEYGTKLRADYPGRFGVFAAIPFPDVDASLKEIAYALDTLKCDGVGMFTSYGKTYLGDAVFNPIFEELNRRKAVMFVHPSNPSCCTGMLDPISDSDIEFGTDTSRAIARVIMGGASIKYPDMKIICSHGGGTIPYLQWRFRHDRAMPKNAAGAPVVFEDEAKKMYYDIAQAASPVPMFALSKFVALEHMLFGSDYPYLTVKDNVDGLATCGVFSKDQLAKIDRANAVALLGHA
jgi:6-methylsalicylate decarboxylase